MVFTLKIEEDDKTPEPWAPFIPNSLFFKKSTFDSVLLTGSLNGLKEEYIGIIYSN